MISKYFGMLGGVFLSLSFIPSVSIVFTILGLIFLGVAINDLAKGTKGFSYFLIGAVLALIASLLFYFKLVAIIVSLLLGATTSEPVVMGASILIYIAIYYVLSIASAVYYYKSFALISKKFNNSYFDYGGKFLVIGSVLNPFAVGLIISVVAWILIIIGFVTVEDIIEVEIIEEEEKLLKS